MNDLLDERIELTIENVRKVLAEDSHNEQKIIEKIEEIRKKEGDILYRALLQVLAHLDLPEEEAKKNWFSIIKHREEMSRKLGREVSFRVALCDYFFNINRKINNPKVIEIEIYEDIERKTYVDVLTGLFNRSYLDIALEREFARAKRHDLDLSLIMIDLDDFKKYNDTYGHIEGDNALKAVAGEILRSKRLQDIAMRYGGEEFAIILPDTRKSGSVILGERLRRHVEMLSPFSPSTRLKERITISMGAATFPQDAKSPLDLLRCADEALFMAKKEGKNRLKLYSPEMRRYPRIAQTGEVKFDVLNGAVALRNTGCMKNLSEGGLQFETDREVPPKSTLAIEMKVPELNSCFVLVGEVVNVTPIGTDPPKYLVGISFVKIDGEARKAIKNIVSEKLENQNKQPAPDS